MGLAIDSWALWQASRYSLSIIGFPDDASPPNQVATAFGSPHRGNKRRSADDRFPFQDWVWLRPRNDYEPLVV